VPACPSLPVLTSISVMTDNSELGVDSEAFFRNTSFLTTPNGNVEQRRLLWYAHAI
jgi:hypothetical protein